MFLEQCYVDDWGTIIGAILTCVEHKLKSISAVLELTEASTLYKTSLDDFVGHRGLILSRSMLLAVLVGSFFVNRLQPSLFGNLNWAASQHAFPGQPGQSKSVKVDTLCGKIDYRIRY